MLIWVTHPWLGKAWTQWELELFAKAKSEGRRVIPVLRVPWDDEVLGPYLTRQVAVDEQCNDDERLWLVVCGGKGEPPGPRESWAQSGRGLATRAAGPADEPQPPPPGSIEARLEDAFQRRDTLILEESETTEVDSEILQLKREQRHGPTLHAGEYLGEGRFRLLEVIGRGGFATVWKAFDRQDRQLVAVKVLHGQFAKDSSRRERLFRGARKMAELRHPDIVRVVVPEGEEQGFHYYVMEYVAGGDLHQAVIDERLDVDGALSVVESIAGALEVAHQSGLVHRDVKPQNILLRKDGGAALTDFDLVQSKDTTGGTRTGAMGTVVYAAPEQNDDARTVDHRADVFSLGMTAAFCVHGGKLPMTAMYQRDAFLSALPCEEEVREVLGRAIALQATDRFEDMASFRSALASSRGRGETIVERDVVRRPVVGRRKLVLGAVGVGGVAATSWLLQRLFRDEPIDDEVEVAEKGSAGVVAPVSSTGSGASTSTATGDEDVSGGDLLPAEIHVPKAGTRLVLIPGGTFMMGSPEGIGDDDERPQHEVTLESFYLAKTPVTNAQYREYLEARPKAPKPRYWDDEKYNQPNQPVVGVSWQEAQAYCEWAGLRLPTEAQWEYACRAGTTTRYHSGNSEEDLARVGWYRGNSGTRLHGVAELEPNEFGLYDMHGNVFEWCQDAFGSYETSPRPGDGLRHEPEGGAFRVVRGGDFDYAARDARSAFRYFYGPVSRDGLVGFRPAQVIPSSITP